MVSSLLRVAQKIAALLLIYSGYAVEKICLESEGERRVARRLFYGLARPGNVDLENRLARDSARSRFRTRSHEPMNVKVSEVSKEDEYQTVPLTIPWPRRAGGWSELEAGQPDV